MKTDKKPQPENSIAKSTTDDAAALLNTLMVQETLMRAAQRFAISFEQDRRWASDADRLNYTLSTWKDLAFAALEFAKHNSTVPSEQISQQS